MKTDSPPKMRERSPSVDEDLRGAKPVFEHEQKCQEDHTPMKPRRQISGTPSQFRFFSDHEMPYDGPAADHTSVLSGISDPTGFGSLDSSWRSFGFDTSSRLEVLGPLRENVDESYSFNVPPQKLVSSSYMMHHTSREPSTKDMPPQPVCDRDEGTRVENDADTFGSGVKYHDDSPAFPVLLSGEECADPLKAACSIRNDPKLAYMEGAIDCGDNGFFCTVTEQDDWEPRELLDNLNFGYCNRTKAFDGTEFQDDGHCHGSDDDSAYYWVLRDHWFRQYNGRLRCCCNWDSEEVDDDDPLSNGLFTCQSLLWLYTAVGFPNAEQQCTR
ncbi:unnamed protein product [Cylindrotheca closterium]|uniref:Uncharacterized protein n=1 Tax=Cylindrotheca closterium TaxID=2856 RepID=A0AAD2G2P6_9STRA|nr:unnamed protein product [Cylindrotheca closterium]